MALGSESKKQIRKQIVKQSAPFILSRMFGMGANYVMIYLLSHSGTESERSDNLAASSLISSGQLITSATAVGVLYSVAIFAGRQKGTGNDHAVGGILQSSLVMSLGLSIPVIALTLPAKTLYELIGQKPALALISQEYFWGYAAGVPAFLAMNAWQQMLVSYRYPNVVLISTMTYTGMIAGFGYLLTYKIGLGVRGVGYAVSISSWLSFLGLIGYTWCDSRLKNCNIFKLVPYQVLWANIKGLSKIGFPIAAQLLSELITFFVITIYSSFLPDSKLKLTAKQIADSYLTIFVVVSFGFGQTIASLISHQVGAENFQNARTFGVEGLKIGLVISVLVAIIFASLNKQLASLLLPSSQRSNTQLDLVRNLMITNGIGMLFDYLRNISAAAARGYSLTKMPFYISATSMTLLCLSLATIFTFVLRWDIESIFVARAIGMLVGAAGNLRYWDIKSKEAIATQSCPKEANLCSFFRPRRQVVEDNDEQARSYIRLNSEAEASSSAPRREIK